MTISTNPRSLTGAQRRILRGLGHGLKPTVQVGRHGITDGLIQATKQALETHELIKLSVGGEAPVDRKSAPKLLAAQTGSHVAQIIGRTALLYRRRHDDPAIRLPGVIDEAPRPDAQGGDEA
jgi:RNA-binding protein